MEATQEPGPWAGVLLSDEEAIQIIAVLADVLDGHDVRDAVSAAWSLLGNRLGDQAGVADPSPEDLASLHRRLADRPRPWANRRYLRRCRRTDRLHVCKPNTSGQPADDKRPAPPVELLLVGAGSTAVDISMSPTSSDATA
jgi:hypothetical protein